MTSTFSGLKNGEFVIGVHGTMRNIGIFTKSGELVYEGNYREFVDNDISSLHGVFVSEDGQTILLSPYNTMSLSKISGELLWKRQGVMAADCHFISSKSLIVTKIFDRNSPPESKDRYVIQILSFDDGSVIDEIKGIAEITMIGEHLLVKKQGVYYEYEIQ